MVAEKMKVKLPTKGMVKDGSQNPTGSEPVGGDGTPVKSPLQKTQRPHMASPHQLCISPLRARERILVYAQEGSGKTKGFFDIILHTGPTCWYIDNDNTTERFVDSSLYLGIGVREEYWNQSLIKDYCRDDGRLIIFHCDGWEDNCHAIKEIWSRAERDDWICIDSLSFLWDNVQSWYTEKLYKTDVDAYFLKAREAQLALGDDKKHTAGEAMFNEWGFINPIYTKNVTEKIINQPCHLYMTAEFASIDQKEKDKSVRDLYLPYGGKPKGQKRSGHNSHTVLKLEKQRRLDTVKYTMTTVKDREREGVDEWEYGDMWNGYIKQVAGW